MAETPWWERSYEPGWPTGQREPSYWSSWIRSGGKCEYCGLDATADARLLAILHGEHIVPKNKGGSNHELNLVLACAICNQIKGRDYDPSHGAGVPRTEEDRKRLIEKTKAEISKRVSERSPWEFPHYFRVWQLAVRTAKPR